MTTGTKVVAYVGSYTSEDPAHGGIQVLDATDPATWVSVGHVPEPREAGYLAYAPQQGVLFAVDERKTDGRGPVGPEAAVHALAVDPATGQLTWSNSQRAFGAFPTYLALDEQRQLLIAVSHGSFDHIEKVVPDAAGGWRVEYLYDDSTVAVYDITDGGVGDVRDVQVLTGHGLDPNTSPQAGGHGQAHAHAHCAVVTPVSQHLIVCDKATDRINVYALDATLTLLHTVQMEEQTGPRHAAFGPNPALLYVTLEFSSELASFTFDPATGELTLADRCSTVAADFEGLNEPAEVRVHPNGGHVYVNNRGEDSLAWFATDQRGTLRRSDDVRLAKSVHPGLAARSFDFHPAADVLAVADRPADLVRLYGVDPATGNLTATGEVAVGSPAFVTFATLNGVDA